LGSGASPVQNVVVDPCDQLAHDQATRALMTAPIMITSVIIQASRISQVYAMPTRRIAVAMGVASQVAAEG
jgi:hypothetical protein